MVQTWTVYIILDIDEYNLLLIASIISFNQSMQILTVAVTHVQFSCKSW